MITKNPLIDMFSNYFNKFGKVEGFSQVAIGQTGLGNFFNIAYRRNDDNGDVLCSGIGF